MYLKCRKKRNDKLRKHGKAQDPDGTSVPRSKETSVKKMGWLVRNKSERKGGELRKELHVCALFYLPPEHPVSFLELYY